MMKKIIINISIFLLIIANTSLSGFAADKKRFIVGVSGDFPPFNLIKNRQIVGLDIDLFDQIAKELDIEIEYKQMEFAAIIPSITSNRIDFGLSGITKTVEREKQILFSNCYYKSHFVAISLNKDITSIEDLKGKKVYVQDGTTMEIYAKKLNANKKFHLKSISNNNVAIQGLRAGHCDVIIFEKVPALYLKKIHPEFTIIDLPGGEDCYAIGISKKNNHMIDKINQAIDKMSKNKNLEEIYSKWL